MLEQYLYSWEYANMAGILTCEEKNAFDVSPEICSVFCIELTGILIQRGLLELFSTTSGVVGATSKGDTPPHNIPVSLDGKGTEDEGE